MDGEPRLPSTLMTRCGNGVCIAAIEMMLIFCGGRGATQVSRGPDADEHAQSHDWLPNAVGRRSIALDDWWVRIAEDAGPRNLEHSHAAQQRMSFDGRGD
jgi:hypothetical protein